MNKYNAIVEVKKENGFEHIYIDVDGLKVQVKLIKYNRKLMYKLMHMCEGK